MEVNAISEIALWWPRKQSRAIPVNSSSSGRPTVVHATMAMPEGNEEGVHLRGIWNRTMRTMDDLEDLPGAGGCVRDKRLGYSS